MSHALIALLGTDMTGKHEQMPHGVPTSYSWSYEPIIQAGNKPGANPYGNPWGQLYTVSDGNTQPDALVEIRDMQAWTLDSTGVWTPLYSTEPTITGAEYPEDFQGSDSSATIDTSVPGSIISAPTPGNLFHFYPAGSRATVPSTMSGFVSMVRARLVEGTYAPDAQCPGYILNAGGDYWPAPASGNVAGIGQGRFKTVKPSWRTFLFSTLTSAQLSATSPLPPIDVDLGELY